jgi:RNase P subunit RPR2
MKISAKKVFCPGCQKLVRYHEQKIDHQVQVLCSKCDRSLRIWNGVCWQVPIESD